MHVFHSFCCNVNDIIRQQLLKAGHGQKKAAAGRLTGAKN
jgi:hypothetical protein